jgi:hypothetical protein
VPHRQRVETFLIDQLQHRILTAFTTGLVMNELAAPDPRGNAVLLWTQLVGPDRFPQVHEAMPHMVDRDIDETFRTGLDMLLGALEESRV